MITKLSFFLPLCAFIYGAFFGTGVEGMTQGDAMICALIIWATYMLKVEGGNDV